MTEDKDSKEMHNYSLEEQVEMLSSCNYTPTEMAIYLEVDKKKFISQANDPDTAIYEAIQRGILVTEFNISHTQKRLSEAGNITAVQTYRKIQREKQVETTKKRIWFGT